MDGSARWSIEHARRVITDNDADELAINVLAELRASARPVPRDWLADRLTVLWTMFMASRSGTDAGALTIWLAEHLRLLGDLPHDLIARAIDRAVQSARHGFIPSIGEIRSLAEPEADERDKLIRRLATIAG